MIDLLVGALTLLVALAIAAWILSPLETLIWWQRDGGRATEKAHREYAEQLTRSQAHPAPDQDDPGVKTTHPTVVEAARSDTRCYVVYLSGIAAFDDDFLPRAERPILRRLERTFTDLRVVGTIYPYAVDNRSLVDERRSSPLWKWLASKQETRTMAALLALTINLRNIYQVLVSADPRYGPVFSAGVAQTLWNQLREAGYRPDSGATVVLLGWSGGAQIAAGAAWYLGSVGVPVTLVSMGGIFSADPGLRRCQRIHHLVGSRDWQARWMAPVVFPGRRRWARHSSWNEALAEGRATQWTLGPFKHVGRGSYLSGWRLPDGRTCSQTTSEAIARVIRDDGLATPVAASRQPGAGSGHGG